MPKLSEVAACQFSAWSSKFSSNVLRGEVFPLPMDFVQYLLSDGCILPNNARFNDDIDDDEEFEKIGAKDGDSDSDSEADGRKKESGGDSSKGSVEGASSTLNDSSHHKTPNFDFPELESFVNVTFAKFKNDAFVKLNWSSPDDASWTTIDNTIRCSSYRDVVKLLKSSSKIGFDITRMIQDCDDYTKEQSEGIASIESPGLGIFSHIKLESRPFPLTLVMKKWINLDPSMEFRLFVVKKELRGICQRDCSAYYDFLGGMISEIQSIAAGFFKSHILKFELESYTVDIFIDKAKKPWILDFNVFGNPTDSLLFEWNEFDLSIPLVVAPTHIGPIVRYITKNSERKPDHRTQYRYPADVTEAPDFVRFKEIVEQQRSERAAASAAAEASAASLSAGNVESNDVNASPAESSSTQLADLGEGVADVDLQSKK